MKLMGIGLNSILSSTAQLRGMVLQAAALAWGLMIGAVSVQASESLFISRVAASSPPSGAIQLCKQYSWACATRATNRLSDEQALRVIKHINRQVNASTREVSDQAQYKQREMWALPTPRGGDCEDFALLKKRDLIRAGVDPSKLLIATVLDRRRNAHAVLVYRSNRGDLVLDNLTSSIKPWAETRYVFLRMQDPKQPGRWVGVFSKS